MSSIHRLWVVVPAAGHGARMATERPKQYLQLHGSVLLVHTLMRLAQTPCVAGIMVALAVEDPYWQQLSLPQSVEILTVQGGAQRHQSVLNALYQLRKRLPAHDWVLVHDAARPCVRGSDISYLVESLWEDEEGGLLGVPVDDTMKRADVDSRIRETVSRNGLWHALTPQMFRLGKLIQSIETAQEQGCHITDEASAMEHCGWRPRLVAGQRDNIKVTTPGDLELAALYLRRQEQEV